MVKCAECGYLASRNYESRKLEETESGTRNGAAIVISLSTGMPIYEPPICFMQVIDLRYEYENNAPQITPVIQQSRECNEFIEWKQGSTPKEHREMMDRQWMQKYQDERDEKDRKWREEQRRLDLEWREKQESEARGRHRWDLIVTGIIATILISAATIGAALIVVEWGTPP
jgi:hypothetical protein